MLVGMKHGKVTPDDRESQERTYSSVKRIVKKFEELNGTIKCKELLGCDINTAEGLNYARENNLFSTKCVKCVEDAARIAEEELFD